MRSILGYCDVVSDASLVQTLVVSQQLVVDEQNCVVGASKTYTLGSIDGTEVAATDNPMLFTGADGTRYRRVTVFKPGPPPSSAPSFRRRT